MKLVLVRHGQSVWNKENLFTGWTDVPLSENGIQEARNAGKLLKEQNLAFDRAFTSVLTRANNTLHLILEEMEQLWLPTTKSWRLNERHYGALQGLNKKETAEKYGDPQVLEWRRSYSTLPPLLTYDDPRNPRFDRRYHDLAPQSLPMGESLETTLARVIPFWEDNIAPSLLAGENVIVAAHGNSLRSLIKYLENISDDDIMSIELPTGEPIVYTFDDELNIVSKEPFLHSHKKKLRDLK